MPEGTVWDAKTYLFAEFVELIEGLSTLGVFDGVLLWCSGSLGTTAASGSLFGGKAG